MRLPVPWRGAGKFRTNVGSNLRTELRALRSVVGGAARRVVWCGWGFMHGGRRGSYRLAVRTITVKQFTCLIGNDVFNYHNWI